MNHPLGKIAGEIVHVVGTNGDGELECHAGITVRARRFSFRDIYVFPHLDFKNRTEEGEILVSLPHSMDYDQGTWHRP